MTSSKSSGAFRTISEVAERLEIPAHVLRFWESRFHQVSPVKRAGGRRYYRPHDVALLGGIKKLLHGDGMTIRGVQKVLRERGVAHVAGLSPAAPSPGATSGRETTAPAPATPLELTAGPSPDSPTEHPALAIKGGPKGQSSAPDPSNPDVLVDFVDTAVPVAPTAMGAGLLALAARTTSLTSEQARIIRPLVGQLRVHLALLEGRFPGSNSTSKDPS